MTNNIERIDFEQFNALRDLLEDDLNDLVQLFFEDSKLRMDEIYLALETRDNRLGYEAVHAIKGASANLGANLLSDLCYKLQMQCKEKQILNSEALIHNIDKERQLLIEELKKELKI